MFGFTYQVSGRPGRPLLNVNILSGLAPGVLRKIFFRIPGGDRELCRQPALRRRLGRETHERKRSGLQQLGQAVK
jgi:hypothetical protein